MNPEPIEPRFIETGVTEALNAVPEHIERVLPVNTRAIAFTTIDQVGQPSPDPRDQQAVAFAIGLYAGVKAAREEADEVAGEVAKVTANILRTARDRGARIQDLREEIERLNIENDYLRRKLEEFEHGRET